MKFIDIIDNLKKENSNDTLVRNNGTLLLCPGKIPKAKHIIFKGLTDNIIQDELISQYKNNFPKEYIEFLKYSNGIELYMFKIKKEKLEFADVNLAIYGLPLVPPFVRPKDEEEPFDVRIEDLGRHDSIPKTWLKCGDYRKNTDYNERTEIFIDTITEKVYSCSQNSDVIVKSWDSLDECLCDIYNLICTRKSVYEY